MTKIKQLLKKWRKNRFFWLSVILLVVGALFIYNYAKGEEVAVTEYVTAKATKGTLTVSASGSGQVSASNQVDVKSKASGLVTDVKIKKSQTVKENEILVELDKTDAIKAIKDAYTNLESAQLSMNKLLAPVDSYQLMQSETAVKKSKDDLDKLILTQKNNYANTVDAKRKAEDNITKAYEDAFNKISDAFLDLPTLMIDAYNRLNSNDISNNESTWTNTLKNTDVLYKSLYADPTYQDKIDPYITNAINDYSDSRKKYDENLANFNLMTRYSSRTEIELLLDNSVISLKAIAQSLKSQNNMFDSWVDYRTINDDLVFSKVTTYQSELRSDIGTANSHLSGLLSTQKSLKDNIEALKDAERNIVTRDLQDPIDLASAKQNIVEKEASLKKLKDGVDELDIRSQQLTIQQRQNTLYEAQQNLSDYTIRAPFDGVIAELSVKKGDNLGSSGAVAVLITKQRIATIPFNEVDIAKIKIGQKAVLTFDAIEGLFLTGKVIEIDEIGAVSQGVVNYSATISFDTQDERIKPNMSVSVTIIINNKIDVYILPLGAVKQQGDVDYVEIKNGEDILTKNVVLGLSNDTMVEIVSGISTDDDVVVQKKTNTTATAQSSQANSSLPGFGGAMNARRLTR